MEETMIRKSTRPPALATPAHGVPSPNEGRRRDARQSRRPRARRRLRATATSLLALATLSLGVSAPARAQTAPAISFQYTTTIDTTDAGGGPGTPLIITYRFDPNLAPGSGGGGPEEGVADYGPLDRVTVQLGDQCVAQSTTGSIGVFNGPNSLFVEDSYVVSWQPAPSAGPSLFGMDLRLAQVVLIDRNSAMFNSTALPTTPDFSVAAPEQQTDILLFNPGTHRFVDLFAGGAPGGLGYFIDPADRILDIQAQVLAADLNNGLKTALQNALQKARDYLTDASKSNDGMAAKELQKFIDQVNALPGNVIAKADAVRLTKIAAKTIFTISQVPPC
jgi:hypothetical protein